MEDSALNSGHTDTPVLTYYENGKEVRVDLAGAELLLGRDDSACDIAFPLPYMSRIHCKVSRLDEGWEIRDLQSRNGTFVNGRRVTQQILATGDQIHFSHQLRDPLTFQVGEPKAAPIVFEDEEADIKSSIVNATFNLDDLTSGLSSGLIETAKDTGTWTIDLFSRMGEVLLTSETLEEMLGRVLDMTFDSLPIERGAICTYDEAEDVITPRSTRAGRVSAPIKISRTIANEVINAKKAVLVRDASQDERFNEAVSIVQMNIHSAMCAPMYHQGRVLGLVYVDNQSGTGIFTEQHLEVLTSVAVFAAVGVQQSLLREDIEREKSIRARLARYSSPGVVDQIVSGSDGGGEMLAEEKDVTVLFADLSGFTTMSERLGPGEVALFLNSIFGRMTEIIFQHEGTLDKFIGDAIMAVFGAPLTQDDHAQRAIRAALNMQAALVELNSSGLYDLPIGMRIGLNSGLVVAGDIGAPDRKDYSVIGDTVNVASRLESSVAESGQVVVGPRTQALAKDTFRFEALPEIRLKGKERTIQPYRVLDTIDPDELTDPDSVG